MLRQSRDDHGREAAIPLPRRLALCALLVGLCGFLVGCRTSSMYRRPHHAMAGGGPHHCHRWPHYAPNRWHYQPTNWRPFAADLLGIDPCFQAMAIEVSAEDSGPERLPEPAPAERQAPESPSATSDVTPAETLPPKVAPPSGSPADAVEPDARPSPAAAPPVTPPSNALPKAGGIVPGFPDTVYVEP